MEYSDNPRKVYGRVDIIYSDSQISDDIKTSTNSKAEISHPDEVFKGFLSPTVKACTMDGNSSMEGSFQMMDDSCVVGWWSKSHANSSGNFVGTKPYIELTFVKRPIITWIILGDNKLNQYPVNFTVDYYDGGIKIKTENIINNTTIEVKLEPRVEDITRIRLTVSSWSMPNAGGNGGKGGEGSPGKFLVAATKGGQGGNGGNGGNGGFGCSGIVANSITGGTVVKVDGRGGNAGAGGASGTGGIGGLKWNSSNRAATGDAGARGTDGYFKGTI